MDRSVIVVALLFAVLAAGCGDFPGADGRYATHDHGANNRGEGSPGLPVTPYVPR